MNEDIRKLTVPNSNGRPYSIAVGHVINTGKDLSIDGAQVYAILLNQYYTA